MQIVLSAAKWTEQNQLLIYQFGRALTSEEQNIALLVGVSKPERVHICEVPEIKRPQEPELAALCEQFGFLTKDTIGLTLGYGIYIKQGYLTTRLLSHELRHVYQYEQAGSTEAFLTRYIGEIMQFGYFNAPYEIDARSHEIY
ncbi:hypothetical protein ORJ04_06495 [Rheinheimera baltica]|uniref:DUF4157 domain-containing protein n=1 Tax=Rheinheimera baltica TaxID=67576 RepID=A0ABT9HWT3_9GAMM|nr:hypothetical protein [Rheinheimera baltica]MDP5135596.1 hypothetical protein [Rheinheimera baltica]